MFAEESNRSSTHSFLCLCPPAVYCKKINHTHLGVLVGWFVTVLSSLIPVVLYYERDMINWMGCNYISLHGFQWEKIIIHTLGSRWDDLLWCCRPRHSSSVVLWETRGNQTGCKCYDTTLHGLNSVGLFCYASLLHCFTRLLIQLIVLTVILIHS